MNFVRRVISTLTSLFLFILLLLVCDKKFTSKSTWKRSNKQEFVEDYSDSIVVTKFMAPVLPLDAFEENLTDDVNSRYVIKQSAHKNDNDTRVISRAANDTENTQPDQKTCNPKRNVVFLRTHKTGSSTLQAILYRYGELNNLTFALPEIGSNLGAPKLFHPRFVRANSKNKKYNMLVGHARYDKWAFSVTMPPDTVYVTILRKPGDQFQSLYKYYNWFNRFGVSLPEFLINPFLYYKKLERDSAIESALNPNLFDLGLERKYLNDRHKISQHINKIENNFNLVMIMEYFEESLILLKDLLCWDLEAVTFLVKNARSMEGRPLNDEDLDRIKLWNAGDDLLYHHFNITLWQKLNQYDRRELNEEIKTLRERNEHLKEDCVKGSKSKTNGISASRVRSYTIKETKAKNDTCVLLALSNDAFQIRAAKRQFGKHK